MIIGSPQKKKSVHNPFHLCWIFFLQHLSINITAVAAPSQVMLAWARPRCSTDRLTIRGSLISWIPAFPRMFSPKSRTCRTFSSGCKTDILRSHCWESPFRLTNKHCLHWDCRCQQKVKTFNHHGEILNTVSEFKDFNSCLRCSWCRCCFHGVKSGSLAF